MHKTVKGLWAVGLALAAWGCASTPSAGDRHLARYHPDAGGRNPWEWDVRAVPVTNATPEAEAPTNAMPAGIAATNQATQVAASSGDHLRKPMRRGDSITIYLRGIPNPEEIRAVLDMTGEVNLPLIGKTKLEGLTSADAESFIQKQYVDAGYYSKITVSILQQQPEFFIKGEVKHEGKYEMSGETTLLQAITEAGGYTEFAQPKSVKVVRGEEVLKYDAKRIEDGRDKDPLLKGGDIIDVPRRGIFGF